MATDAADKNMPIVASRYGCCVCGKRNRTHPGVRLHLFPQDARRQLQWLQALKLTYVKNTQSVCEDHFEAKYISSSGRLVNTAVPIPIDGGGEEASQGYLGEEMEGIYIKEEIKEEESPVCFDPLTLEDGVDKEIKVEVGEEIVSKDYIPSDFPITDGESTNSSEATSLSEGGNASRAGRRNVARRGKPKKGTALADVRPQRESLQRTSQVPKRYSNTEAAESDGLADSDDPDFHLSDSDDDPDFNPVDKLPPELFYRWREYRGDALVPVNPDVSEDEGLDEDEDVTDPDFVPEALHDPETPGPSDTPPVAKRHCVRLPLQVADALSSEEEEGISRQRGSKGNRTKSEKASAKPTTWKKWDITYQALPTCQHPAPLNIKAPQDYFFTFFSTQMIKHITYQTNLYASQKDVNTTFSTNDNEIVNFVSLLLYMGVIKAPSLDDYWSMKLRIPQVAEVMSSKRFRLLRRTLHFNNNSQLPGTLDRFYKIRPLFSFINEAFRNVPQNSKQSIDEVMVGYNGKTAGNLRQYFGNKSDKSGFKLFSRVSEDGFIHDMVLYQGKTTLQSHDVLLSPAQEPVGVTSQIVSVLASTMTSTSTTAKEDVPCPNGVKSCFMGIDKCNMLVHLYRTPMKSKRWYMRLFAYVVDICVTNAWVLYRRDCKALNQNGMSLKDFRVEVFYSASCKKPSLHQTLRHLMTSPDTDHAVDLSHFIRGHRVRSHIPDASVRFDKTLFHAPLYGARQTCKFCSKKGNIIRSNFFCKECRVHLCLNCERNCFLEYHGSN